MSYYHINCVTVLLVCPGWPPDVSVCSSHGLLFVVGAMCSHVYCLSPPILLPHHYFSGSTCVPLFTLVCLPIYPPGVCSPGLIRSVRMREERDEARTQMQEGMDLSFLPSCYDDEVTRWEETDNRHGSTWHQQQAICSTYRDIW